MVRLGGMAMVDDRQQLDPIEQGLAEFVEAQQAGVFRRTPLDAGQCLLADETRRPVDVRRLMVRLIPVAAVLVLAVTVWTTMFAMQLSEIRENKQQLAARQAEPGPSFATCMNGPSGDGLPGQCGDLDRDTNGQIDLRDYSAFQLAYAGH